MWAVATQQWGRDEGSGVGKDEAEGRKEGKGREGRREGRKEQAKHVLSNEIKKLGCTQAK